MNSVEVLSHTALSDTEIFLTKRSLSTAQDAMSLLMTAAIYHSFSATRLLAKPARPPQPPPLTRTCGGFSDSPDHTVTSQLRGKRFIVF